METRGLWNRAIKHILGTRPAANGDHHECRVLGCHEGPILTIASDGKEDIRLCRRHANTWSESDLCHDFAVTGHTNSLRVLSSWLSYQNVPQPSAPEILAFEFEPRIAA
jgi:hypothetical protein